MRIKAPDNWRNAVAYEAEVQFATALIRIGERLAKDARIVRAPLPERMTALLNELRRRRARKRKWTGGRTTGLILKRR